MAILDSVRHLGATVAGILHTRLELAAVEIEEELHRFSSLLLWSLTALFCACCAVVLLVVFLIAVFWDSYRLTLISVLIAAFGLSAAGIAWWVRKQFSLKPGLLSHSLQELEKDSLTLRRQDRTVTPPITPSGTETSSGQ